LKLIDTPIERHYIKDIPVYVKREDLCSHQHPEAPPFSKLRGLAYKLKELKKKGFNTVGYVETSVSMAGWGIAWLAPKFDLKVVIFDPQYVPIPKSIPTPDHLKLLGLHRKKWKELGAQLVNIQAGRAKVNYYAAKQYIKDPKFDRMTILPLGLGLRDTSFETARIAASIKLKQYYSTVVVNIGSGHICAGVIQGFKNSTAKIIGVMGRTGNKKKKRQMILSYTENVLSNFNGEKTIFNHTNFEIVDPSWEYTQKANVKAPFPCHPYYDLKAWQWLEENIDKLEQPILFWNIGAAPKEIK